MPSIESNTIYRCTRCGAIYNFEDATQFKPCEHCGLLSYEQLVVQAVCDFCSKNLDLEKNEVFWSYPCEDFIYPVQFSDCPEGASKGEWTACATCHELIDDGDLTALAQRSVDTDLQRHPHIKGHRKELISITLQIHHSFMQHRTGAPRKDNPDEPQ